MHKIKLSRLEPEKQIAAGSIVTIVGKRNTGKTRLCLHLMYLLRDKFDFVIAMTPTQSTATALREIMPSACVYDQGLDLGVIERLMAYQADCAAKGKRLRSTLLLMDDTSWDAKSFRTPAPILAQLYRNGRHHAISVLHTCQDCLDCAVGLRGQVDVLMVLREVSLQQRKRLQTAYFGLLTMPEFNAVMDTATEKYGALVLLNTVPTNDPTECLFWWRAKPELPPFRVANDVFYKLGKRTTTLQDLQKQRRAVGGRGGGILVEACGQSVVSA